MRAPRRERWLPRPRRRPAAPQYGFALAKSLRQLVRLESSAHGGIELDGARIVVEDHPDTLDYSTRFLDRHERVGFGASLLRDDAQLLRRDRRGAHGIAIARRRLGGIARRVDVAAQGHRFPIAGD